MKDETLVLTESVEGVKCTLTAKGRVDANSSEVLLYKLEKALKDEHKYKYIILNMSMVEYLSSIGIRVILDIYKKATKEDRIFRIEHPSQIVRNVLGMAALKQLLVAD